jgi:hypothetical protein
MPNHEVEGVQDHAIALGERFEGILVRQVPLRVGAGMARARRRARSTRPPLGAPRSTWDGYGRRVRFGPTGAGRGIGEPPPRAALDGDDDLSLSVPLFQSAKGVRDLAQRVRLTGDRRDLPGFDQLFEHDQVLGLVRREEGHQLLADEP